MTSYSLTPEIFKRADINGHPESLTEWLNNMTEAERDDWYLIAGRGANKHSSIELTQCLIVCLVLLSYELADEKLSVSEDKIKELMGKFFSNILLEKGVRQGLYIIDENLTFYSTSPNISLTEKGKAIAESLTID